MFKDSLDLISVGREFQIWAPLYCIDFSPVNFSEMNLGGALPGITISTSQVMRVGDFSGRRIFKIPTNLGG